MVYIIFNYFMNTLLVSIFMFIIPSMSFSFFLKHPAIEENNEDSSEDFSTPNNKRKEDECDQLDMASTSKKLCTKIIKKEKTIADKWWLSTIEPKIFLFPFILLVYGFFVFIYLFLCWFCYIWICLSIYSIKFAFKIIKSCEIKTFVVFSYTLQLVFPMYNLN